MNDPEQWFKLGRDLVWREFDRGIEGAVFSAFVGLLAVAYSEGGPECLVSAFEGGWAALEAGWRPDDRPQLDEILGVPVAPVRTGDRWARYRRLLGEAVDHDQTGDMPGRS
jgi:hypothetical protein